MTNTDLSKTTENKPLDTRVLIGLPTMFSINTITAIVLMSWVQENRVKMRVYPTLNVSPVDNARNNIVEEFMTGAAKDCSHLLFIDADTIPPQNGLERLLAHDKDIVSGITPIVELDENGEPYRRWNCVDMNDQHVRPHTGVQKIKGAGGSFILIKRRVFEKMSQPYYSFLRTKSLKGEDKLVGEDIHFIVNALNLGFEAYADTDVVCQHYKAVAF